MDVRSDDRPARRTLSIIIGGPDFAEASASVRMTCSQQDSEDASLIFVWRESTGRMFMHNPAMLASNVVS